MEQKELLEVLNLVASGEMNTEEALAKIKISPFEDIDIAKIDTHRGVRQGISEVVYGGGKTPEQINLISKKLWESGQKTVIITRMSKEAADFMDEKLPFTYHEIARIGIVGETVKPDCDGYILVVTAGTSDIAVAEEAAVTAEAMGNNVKRVYDVGVAGIHRLLAHSEHIAKARVIIAIAGMEGALASVVAGLADCPVIAVPTSVGYGTALGGITALFSMLNSCASGVSVVNIDNGFGAAYQAHLINNLKK